MSLNVAIVPVTAFQQNCSLIWDDVTMTGAVIDPGGDADRITAAIDQKGVTVEKILLTHGHIDHIAGVGALVSALEVPVEGPQAEDGFWIDQLESQARFFGWQEIPLPVVPTRWLDQGDTVTVGGLTLEVLHCPGHTPGHVVYFEPQAKVAFVGDVLFAGSVGRSDFPRSDGAVLIRSIKERLLPLGDDVRFVPGHGPASTLGHERVTNPYLR